MKDARKILRSSAIQNAKVELENTPQIMNKEKLYNVLRRPSISRANYNYTDYLAPSFTESDYPNNGKYNISRKSMSNSAKSKSKCLNVEIKQQSNTMEIDK